MCNSKKIEEAKEKDIFEVARQLGLTLEIRGNRATTKEHDSLTLYRKGGTSHDDYTRYSDGSAGSCIDLVMNMNGCNFKDAVEYLVDGNLPRSVYVEPVQTPERTLKNFNYKALEADFWDEHKGRGVRDYMNKVRGIYFETLSECGVGVKSNLYIGKNLPSAQAVSFPYYNEQGQLVAVRYRCIGKNVSKKDRLRSESGSSFRGKVFGTHMPILDVQDEDTLFVFEGEINCLSARNVGFNAVSVGSQSAACSDSLVNFCQKFKKVVVWMDEEEHAVKLSSELRERLNNVEVKHTVSVYLTPNKAHDANDIMVKISTHALEEFLTGLI